MSLKKMTVEAIKPAIIENIIESVPGSRYAFATLLTTTV